ncbi:hypothetical protein [Plantactinospora sp. WMMB782]|uniref:hypothetical protein n=1 Tax=Plantactinospora sp. WMMB782 TaxID=3404121 RepID=UPI003B95520E
MEQIEVSHPDWCRQDDGCRRNADGSVTHVHVHNIIGDTARVLAEQVDTPDESGKLRPGDPKVVTEFPAGARLSNADMRRVVRAHARVAKWTGESNTSGGVL